MRRFLPVVWYVLGAAAVWFVDAMLFSFYDGGVSFSSALWDGMPLYHLIIRIAAVIFILFLGYCKFYELWKQASPASVWREPDAREDILWGCAESHDKSRRILYQSLKLAEYFKMNDAQKNDLRILCYCYDMGKVALPFEVLESNPRGELAQEIYDRHMALGAELAGCFTELRSAALLIKYHHEYYNGSGPYGMRGKHIPLACRIFQVVWAFDSMLYPVGRTRSLICDEALLELRYYSGTAFDPEVVEAFITKMSKHTILSGIKRGEFSLR